MRFIAVLFGFSALSACAQPGIIDRSAVPTARANFNLALDRCNADRGIDTYSKGVECLLRADLDYAKTIMLKKPELFAAYIQRARLAATEMDAAGTPETEARERIARIRSDYIATISSAMEAEDIRRQDNALRAAAVADAMGTLQASMPRPAPVYAPPPPATLRCRTINLGNGISRTNCD